MNDEGFGMNLTKDQVAGMIDISAVKAESSLQEVQQIVEAAKQHKFIAVFTLPSFASQARELLGEKSAIFLGGTVGFPSGASTTSTKAFEANELVELGCQELDMVINIGKLKSGLFNEVALDIKKVVEVASPAPVKVILEVGLLTDVEIDAGAKIVCESGAAYVKTGTGWNGVTTVEHITIIKNAVGDHIKLKAAGGVRDLDFLLKMYEMGVVRFGIGYRSAIGIMEEYVKRSAEQAWENKF